MSEILKLLNGVVWGVPALVLILGVGLILSLRTRFVQIKLFTKKEYDNTSLSSRNVRESKAGR